ncbi:HTH-type transcriptional regulator YesS [Paenibacillus konkukensis]|uniref:HTH-type transcriptional regulator YesS n=1 Tax=Paenibacillus konkukensis TaxID=2020716 RepID=A0ABY4RP53_9BACL|nr:response regulator [Paenibacillus konkukensis]UQZ83494.1 HTH-type transcriptional regulator YesS [Paenibacillus konkukensis]
MWKIAIIDDDPSLLEGMRESIPWHELNAEWAGQCLDGSQGVEWVLEHRPDIVITDINMPVMNGLEMIEKLRERKYQGKFIILSGYSDFEYARQALRLEVDDYVSKPITIEGLMNVMSRTIGRLSEEKMRHSENEDADKKIRVFEPYIVKEWLKSVLVGSAAKDVMDLELIKLKAAKWERQTHLVLCLELLESEGLDNWYAFDRGVMQFAVQNIVQELVEQQALDYDYVQMNGRQFALILHSDERGADAGSLPKQAVPAQESIATSLAKHLKLHTAAGIGTVQDDWNRICESFESASQALRQLPEEGGPSPEGAAGRSVRFYHQLAEAIRNAQEEQAKALVRTYIAERSPFAKADMKLLAGELWAIIAYSLYDVGVDLKQIYPAFEPVPETSGALEPWLETIVTTIIHSTHMSENMRHRKVVEFVIQFVHEHYMEDITLGLLADKVQISKNYLGQIFKNVMQETFNQYVTRIRMEKAKGMLLEGNLYIYEVAEKVGYNSISYFSTQFKKITGYNPTDLIN